MNSVLDQKYANFEVIIVDDGSTDDTKKEVSTINDNRVSYYKIKNGERGAARNYGANKAKGDYVYFLDSDDILYPSHLETAIQFIKDNETPPIFFLKYEITNMDGSKTQIPFLQGSLNEMLLTKGNILSCHGVFLKRKIAIEHPFNPDRQLAGSEDYELWVRLACYYEILYSNEITSTLISHEDRSVLNMEKDKLINRQELFFKYAFQNEAFLKKYGTYKQRIKSNFFSYTALHLALTKKYPLASLKYLMIAFWHYPKVVFNRRFLGTIKHVLLTYT